MKLVILLTCIGLFLIVFFVFFPPQAPEQTPEEKAPSFSWKENIGQLLIIGFEDKELTPELTALLQKIRPSGVLLLSRNIEDEAQLVRLIEDLQKISLETTGHPLFIAVDQEGKALSRIPFAKDARDLRKLGVNTNLAPVLDSRSKSDFLYPRSVRDLDAALDFVEEHQKLDILMVPKHFPGYDGVVFNPEITIIPEVSVVPETTLFEELFQEFHFPFVMVSHVVYKNLDQENVFPFSTVGISLLKEKLGGQVFVMSDDILSLAFLREFSYEEIARKALEAGIDSMIAAGYPNASVVGEFYETLVSEVENDKALQALVEERAKTIIELKLDVVHNARIPK